ncbi:MAG: hypothetical protein INR73_01275 [Williamsia sp.]|nr:hypothetical protein [Williamsia sp.]
MQPLKTILLNIHIFASITWVGSVFMGTFVDWPAAKASVKPGEFPFKFIIGQGHRVFVFVYIGIFFVWTSGIGLTLIHAPFTGKELVLLGIKIAALTIMTGFTLYGTFGTWRKLQVATHAEAFNHYKYYMYRAMGTFTLGSLAAVMGGWLL